MSLWFFFCLILIRRLFLFFRSLVALKQDSSLPRHISVACHSNGGFLWLRKTNIIIVFIFLVPCPTSADLIYSLFDYSLRLHVKLGKYFFETGRILLANAWLFSGQGYTLTSCCESSAQSRFAKFLIRILRSLSKVWQQLQRRLQECRQTKRRRAADWFARALNIMMHLLVLPSKLQLVESQLESQTFRIWACEHNALLFSFSISNGTLPLSP